MNLSDAAYNDILDNVLPTLCPLVQGEPLVNDPMHSRVHLRFAKVDMEEHDYSAQSHDLSLIQHLLNELEFQMQASSSNYSVYPTNAYGYMSLNE